MSDNNAAHPFDQAEIDKHVLLSKVDWVLNWARKSSLFMFSFGLA